MRPTTTTMTTMTTTKHATTSSNYSITCAVWRISSPEALVLLIQCNATLVNSKIDSRPPPMSTISAAGAVGYFFCQNTTEPTPLAELNPSKAIAHIAGLPPELKSWFDTQCQNLEITDVTMTLLPLPQNPQALLEASQFLIKNKLIHIPCSFQIILSVNPLSSLATAKALKYFHDKDATLSQTRDQKQKEIIRRIKESYYLHRYGLRSLQLLDQANLLTKDNLGNILNSMRVRSSGRGRALLVLSWQESLLEESSKKNLLNNETFFKIFSMNPYGTLDKLKSMHLPLENEMTILNIIDSELVEPLIGLFHYLHKKGHQIQTIDKHIATAIQLLNEKFPRFKEHEHRETIFRNLEIYAHQDSGNFLKNIQLMIQKGLLSGDNAEKNLHIITRYPPEKTDVIATLVQELRLYTQTKYPYSIFSRRLPGPQKLKAVSALLNWLSQPTPSFLQIIGCFYSWMKRAPFCYTHLEQFKTGKRLIAIVKKAAGHEILPTNLEARLPPREPLRSSP